MWICMTRPPSSKSGGVRPPRLWGPARIQRRSRRISTRPWKSCSRSTRRRQRGKAIGFPGPMSFGLGLSLNASHERTRKRWSFVRVHSWLRASVIIDRVVDKLKLIGLIRLVVTLLTNPELAFRRRAVVAVSFSPCEVVIWSFQPNSQTYLRSHSVCNLQYRTIEELAGSRTANELAQLPTQAYPIPESLKNV